MKKVLLFSFALLLGMATMAQPRAMFLSESFNGTSLPTGWSVVGQGSSNWNISATNNAGGEPNELWLYYNPTFNGLSRFVSPAIDLTGVSSVVFSFKHALDNYSGSHVLGIATSSDNGTTWNEAWSQTYSSDGVWSISQEINTPDMGQSNVKFCLFYQGNSYNIDNWYFDDINIFSMENLDIAVASVVVSDFYSSDDPSSMAAEVPIGAKVFNYGATTITSVEATYEVEGEAPVTETFTVGIPSLGNTTLNFTTPITLNPGGYTVTVSVNKVNGVVDDVLDNNEASKSFSVAMAKTDRIPMIEHFSSSTCGPCVSVNNQMNTFCNNNQGRFTYTKYQMNWPGNGDPYYTAEGGVRRVYYGVSGVPDIYLDGVGTNNAAVNQNVFNQHAAEPGFMDIRGSFTVEGTTIHVMADIIPFIDITARVYISVNEKVTHNNVGSNGETSFHHVFMKMLPDGQGTTVNFVAGDIKHMEFTQNMSGTHVEEMSDLEVSIWVQNHGSRYVYNSHFAYEYTDEHPYPVQNLALVPSGDNLLVGSWDAPEQGNPVAYNVYLNNVLMAEGITETSYSFEASADQTNVIGVVAVYGEDKTSIKVIAANESVLQDQGLVTLDSPNVFLDEQNPNAELSVTNANYASNTPIDIVSINEAPNATGIPYLVIEAEDLPFSLGAGETYNFTIRANERGTLDNVSTVLTVESSAGAVEFLIEITQSLINVTELSAKTMVYPNPTSGQFFVKGANIAKVEVYNLVGQKVFETENGELTTENCINASNWNKGLYLVTITNKEGLVETMKLVVK